MTEDRESANAPSSSSEGSEGARASSDGGSAASQPSPASDDPHPFDRPSSGEGFQGPETGARPEADPFGSSRGFDAGRGSRAGGDDPFRSEAGAGGLQDLLAMAGMGSVPIGIAKSWIRENQTTAMLGAFAAGVFIGAISRK
ncbi:hypothetical protein [Longibacter sp.]|uniref:hypothetical protein n=1 Tax=Longibacter sp. TaxID=2045415 RepID=UPI003EB8DAD9